MQEKEKLPFDLKTTVR